MRRHEYVVCTYKVDSDLNIGVVADFHINDKTSFKKIRDVLDTLEDIGPSHIVIPGDLYDGRGDIPINKIMSFIGNATSISDVFYTSGNNELKSKIVPYILYNNINNKFHVLDNNQNTIYNNGINISAIDFPLDFYNLTEREKTLYILRNYRDYLVRLSNNCGKGNFNILLCHDPIIIDAIDYLGSDFYYNLVISGHNHGGMGIKGLKPLFELLGKDVEKLYPTYTKGLIDTGDYTKVLVSEGITKYNSYSGKLQNLEKYHEGVIENVKILKRY